MKTFPTKEKDPLRYINFPKPPPSNDIIVIITSIYRRNKSFVGSFSRNITILCEWPNSLIRCFILKKMDSNNVFCIIS